MKHLQLNLLRHGRGKALDIQFLGIQSHRLNKQLVPGLIRKSGDFGFYGGTIPGAYAFDHAAMHGRAIQIGADDPVRLFVGIGQVAYRPVYRRDLGFKREWHDLGIPLLPLHTGKVHAAGIDPRRRTSFEPAERESQLQQAVRQFCGSKHAVRTTLPHALADNGPAVEIGTGTYDGGFHLEYRTGLQHHVADAAICEMDLCDFSLSKGQIFLTLQDVLHDLLVAAAVCLSPQAVDRRAFSTVKQAILDAGCVRRSGHLAPQGVQLSYQMAFSCAADGGIAGHITYSVQINGEADGFLPQPRGGQGGLNACVACANDSDIIFPGGEFLH